MKNSWRYKGYYRRIRTYRELVANAELREENGQSIKWGRHKRSSRFLDSWNLERRHAFSKSWKKKRHTQWYIAGLKTSSNIHQVVLTNYKDKRILLDYLEKHNIPHKVERDCVRIAHYYTQKFRKEYVGTIAKAIPLPNGRICTYYFPSYKETPLNPPIVKTYWTTQTIKYIITWWSDKDIGVSYILNI